MIGSTPSDINNNIGIKLNANSNGDPETISFSGLAVNIPHITSFLLDFNSFGVLELLNNSVELTPETSDYNNMLLFTGAQYSFAINTHKYALFWSTESLTNLSNVTDNSSSFTTQTLIAGTTIYLYIVELVSQQIDFSLENILADSELSSPLFNSLSSTSTAKIGVSYTNITLRM